ncbi:MAG: class I SAM-dependent methyltransferase [Mycobacterium sp.]
MGSTTKPQASTKRNELYEFLRYERWRFPLKKAYRPAVENKRGIEVGGPSAVFETSLPLYRFVGELDGANFSNDTIWEGHIEAGDTFAYAESGTGRQFVADATDLHDIGSASYDFLLSSNCLEHVANPIRALTEWRRVIKPGGALVLVLPNKRSNFDHRRPVTKFEHLLDDFTRDVAEDDLTHLDEILELHDLSRDPLAGDSAHFRNRSLKNFHNRTLHHHVFDASLIERLLSYMDFDVVHTTTMRTDFFALAKKASDR